MSNTLIYNQIFKLGIKWNYCTKSFHCKMFIILSVNPTISELFFESIMSCFSCSSIDVLNFVSRPFILGSSAIGCSSRYCKTAFPSTSLALPEPKHITRGNCRLTASQACFSEWGPPSTRRQITGTPMPPSKISLAYSNAIWRKLALLYVALNVAFKFKIIFTFLQFCNMLFQLHSKSSNSMFLLLVAVVHQQKAWVIWIQWNIDCISVHKWFSIITHMFQVLKCCNFENHLASTSRTPGRGQGTFSDRKMNHDFFVCLNAHMEVEC